MRGCAEFRHSFVVALLPGAVFVACFAGALGAAERETAAVDGWLVYPSQTEPKILEWAERHADLVSLERQRTFEGRTAYAITVTGATGDRAAKRKLLFSQPHAHEPAATAGMMNFLAKLLDGVDLSGKAADLDRKTILDEYLLSFIPDGNPDGRARAPLPWWDGTKYSNDAFLKLAFGREEDGSRAKRVGRWSSRVHQPPVIGFAYERINEHEYVEPNRDRESTFFKLLLRLRDRHQYDIHLDLHQTEFARSGRDSAVFLPFMQEKLPEAIRAENARLGRAIIGAWKQSGANPVQEPTFAGYGEEQNQWFRACWSDLYRTTPHLMVEVQNNNTRTSPKRQRELIEISIVAAIEHAAARRRAPSPLLDAQPNRP
ncbi:MAG: hypothetical protein GX621_10490 [Pirellulaceae bacterium]|nr:hypothetical protein [Pirellulaceae bacterium]